MQQGTNNSLTLSPFLVIFLVTISSAEVFNLKKLNQWSPRLRRPHWSSFSPPEEPHRRPSYGSRNTMPPKKQPAAFSAAKSAMNTTPLFPAPTPHPVSFVALEPENSTEQGDSNGFRRLDPEAAGKAKQRKRQEWSLMTLRQSFLDEDFMRSHLKAARLRIADSNEPATVTRTRSLLRKAGVSGTEIAASVGTAVAGFLNLNPSLPLWAAVALILEATGRFTEQASAA
jgi:hypothetical protein